MTAMADQAATKKEAPVADDQNIAPFSELLLQQRKGRLHAEASDGLHELVKAVQATGKAGELTLTIKVKPLGKGSGNQVTVTDRVNVKSPEAETDPVLWFMDDGNLSRRDPDQPELPISAVADQGTNAKEATA